MLEAGLAILAALITWYAKRRIKRLEDEKAEYMDVLAEIDLAIYTGNQNRVNHCLDTVMRRLHKPQGDSDSGRQGSDTPAGG